MTLSYDEANLASYVFAVYRGRTHIITTGRVPSNDAWILAGIVSERDRTGGAGMSVRATWGVSRTGQIRKGI